MPSDRTAWFTQEILPLERELKGFLRRFFPNDDDARELAQQCFAQVLAIEKPEAIQSPRAFLFITARNLAIQRLRHERVVPLELVAEIEEAGLPGAAPSAEEVSSAREELRLLIAALESLPPQCRQVFTLRKVYGFSQKEIAEKLSISEHTVEKHVTKGVRLCADFLAAAHAPAKKSPSVVTFFRKARTPT